MKKVESWLLGILFLSAMLTMLAFISVMLVFQDEVHEFTPFFYFPIIVLIQTFLMGLASLRIHQKQVLRFFVVISVVFELVMLIFPITLLGWFNELAWFFVPLVFAHLGLGFLTIKQYDSAEKTSEKIIFALLLSLLFLIPPTCWVMMDFSKNLLMLWFLVPYVGIYLGSLMIVLLHKNKYLADR